MRKITTIFFLIFLLYILNTQVTFAQGFFSCYWSGGVCYSKDVSCQDDYESSDSLCTSLSQSSCNSAQNFECICTNPNGCASSTPKPTVTCSSMGGICSPICAIPLNNIGKYDCPGIAPNCCRLKPLTENEKQAQWIREICPPGDTSCENCLKQDNKTYTALGCLPTDPSAFIGWFLTAAIGIAGGIAFLLIIYGGFKVLTSAGNPENLNEGKDIIIAAIAGVLMIVFSVLLLKIIGTDILKIPGFG
ncbi:MAG: hypothetical protein V1858_01585 [Candidatus Gottesmanbacteria bacterium]